MSITRRQMIMSSLGATVVAALSSGATGARKAGHVVLLGDSIFDNQVYVEPGEPGVIDQLRKHLPEDWRATLLAVDGDTTVDVVNQLKGLPDDATHIVISVGGNDGLQASGVLSQPASDVQSALLHMVGVRKEFKRNYNTMIDAVLAAKKPTTLCTVYDPNFADGIEQRVSVLALTAFNDIITRAAVRHGLPVIDLRILFDKPADYANPIEPSAIGGDKLARTIAAVTTGNDFNITRCQVYPGK